MIKKLILSAFAIFCSAGMLMAQSTMSDQQVLDYTKAAVAKGKSHTEIAKELALKGVTRTQAERVKKLYESQQNQKEGTNKKQTNRQIARNDSTYTQQQQLRTPALTTKIKKPIPAETKDRLVYSDADTTSISENDEVQIFGREIFQNRDLNFMPSENLATPKNYRLGPGDEVIIDIFGANQTTLRDEISPEGSINVDILGPIYLNGLTKEHDLDWVFFSPAGAFEDADKGQRTGKFRLGKDDLIVDPATGTSHISVQDYAIAMVDELEKPAHHQERFTIGY